MKDSYNTHLYIHTEKKRRVITVLTAVFIAMFIILIPLIIHAGASDGKEYEKNYIAVSVEAGDTVWSIARDNFNEDAGESLKDCVRDIVRVNGLSGDCTIHQGSKLVVPHYSEVRTGAVSHANR